MIQQREDYFLEFNKAKHFRGKVKWDEVKDLTGPDFLWEIGRKTHDDRKDALINIYNKQRGTLFSVNYHQVFIKNK